jgi:hypothetical protein
MFCIIYLLVLKLFLLTCHLLFKIKSIVVRLCEKHVDAAAATIAATTTATTATTAATTTAGANIAATTITASTDVTAAIIASNASFEEAFYR